MRFKLGQLLRDGGDWVGGGGGAWGQEHAL